MSDRWRRTTSVIIVATLSVIIGWDVVVSLNDQSGDTVSEVVNGWAHYSITIPIALGMVLGHWFIPLGKRTDEWPQWVFGALVVGLLTDLASWFMELLPYSSWMVAGTAVAGVLYGAIVWSLRRPDE